MPGLLIILPLASFPALPFETLYLPIASRTRRFVSEDNIAEGRQEVPSEQPHEAPANYGGGRCPPRDAHDSRP
jgi:hypothetical protein